MSQKYEAHISVWEDVSWRGTVFNTPLPLYVDSESFSVGKDIRSLNNLARDGRVSKVQSQVGGVQRPSGNVVYQPRSEDCGAVLFSHFQMGTRKGSGPYTYTFIPSVQNPTYTNNSLRGEGTTRDDVGDVYSVSFMKKYFDTTENEGTNAIFFQHGICDSLNFDISANDDFKLGGDYKFRDVVVGTTWSLNPGDSGYGTYSTESAWEWFEGTVLVAGESWDINSISWKGNNNLTDKNVTGRRDSDWFAFGDYVLEGEIKLDFPKDGMLQIGSMLGTKAFSIVGTLFKSSSEMLAFSMPNCIRRPFDVQLSGNTIEAGIPFLALESGAVSPITVTLVTDAKVAVPEDIFWDANFGARSIGDYTLVDAGNGARTLSEYTLVDRDL